jgi:hypothetical protein
MKKTFISHALTLSLFILTSLLAVPAQATVWAPQIRTMEIKRYIGNNQHIETYYLTRDDRQKNAFTIEHTYTGTKRKGTAIIIDVVGDKIRMQINTSTLMGTYWFNGTFHKSEQKIIDGRIEYGRLGTFTATYSVY